MFKFPTKALVKLNDLNSDEKIISPRNVLFIIAGIEGHSEIFNSLAESLAQHSTLVFGLEYTLDVPFNTIKESAGFYLTKIRDKLSEINHRNFQLAGYSYGKLIIYKIFFLNFKTFKNTGGVCKNIIFYMTSFFMLI